jgi:glycosyltransferase involved in cell wall biosynthesis
MYFNEKPKYVEKKGGDVKIPTPPPVVEKKKKPALTRRMKRLFGDDFPKITTNHHKTPESPKEITPISEIIPISIIIPAFETQDFIEECLDSIENQTYFDNNSKYEILVGVDGCKKTKEKLLEIGEKYRNLRVFYSEKNVGWPLIKNSLIPIAKFENILFFDSDDVMCENLVSSVANHSKYDVVGFSYMNMFDDVDNPNNQHTEKNAKGSLFIKKSVFEKIGGYLNYVCASDREFNIRLKKNKINFFIISDNPLFYYRRHNNQLTKKEETALGSVLRQKIHNEISQKNNWGGINPETVQLSEISSFNYDLNRPNICLIYDVKGWAFYNKSMVIKKYLNKYYDFDVVGFYDIIPNKNYDIFICFSPSCVPASIEKNKNLIRGISAHTSQMDKHNEKLNNCGFSFSNDYLLYRKLNTINKYYVPNGVNTTFFKHNEDRIIFNKKTINIGLVGSVGRKLHKGSERIEEICNRLVGLGYKVNNYSYFVDSRKEEEVKPLDYMVEYYKNVDIFIVSSVSEATPNPLLEAMAMGIPVISNNTGMAELLIEHGRNGFIVEDYSDIDSYVEHISYLINRTRKYQQFSKRAREKIENFDWSIMVDNYKKMFDDFLNKNNNLENELTILIKTFEREGCLINLINSIRSYYNNIQILVINDGKERVDIDEKNIEVINTEYDVGISAGRNIGIEKVKTKYFILCDDDFVFTEKTNLNEFFKIIEVTNLDILGGRVNSRGVECGFFNIQDNVLELKKINIDCFNDFIYCDYIRNFFIGKTETFKKNNIKWDEDLKMGEHTLFFYNVWVNKLAKIGFTTNVTVDNNKIIPNEHYKIMRNRSQSFTDNCLNKYNLNKIIVDGKTRNIKNNLQNK